MIDVDRAASLLRDAGCYAFLDDEVRQVVQEIKSGAGDAAQIYSRDAWDSVAEAYQRRIEQLYMNDLMLQVKDAVRAYDAIESLTMSGSNEDALKKAASDVARQNGDGYLSGAYERMPLAVVYAGALRQNYVNAQVELVQRLIARRSDVAARLLCGGEFTKVTGLSAACGDMHRHGRCVQRITTDAGSFYYKPHDCRSDHLFYRLVHDWFEGCAYVPRVVLGDDFGFVEELVVAELASDKEASQYYERLGMLLSTLSILCASDMHYENIICCGPRPAAIDLETVIGGNASLMQEERKAGATADEIAAWECNRRLRCTGIMPEWVRKIGLSSPLYTNNIIGDKALPVLHGTRIDARGFEQDFIRGFVTGRDAVIRHRDDILGAIEESKDLKLRFLVRNTVYYELLRMLLRRRKAMASKQARDKVLANLALPYGKGATESPKVRKLIDYEAKCLREGDIPYFCMVLADTTLCGSDSADVLVKGQIAHSGYERIVEWLKSYKRSYCSFEADFIRATLAHVPDRDLTERNAKLGADPVSFDEAKALCSALLDAAWDDHITLVGSGVTWHSSMQALAETYNCGEASLQADVLSYCASILARPWLSDMHEKARMVAAACLARIGRYAEVCELSCQTDGEFALPLGLEDGFGGILMAVVRAMRAGMEYADAIFWRIIRLVRHARMFTDSMVTGGEVGLLMSATAAWAMTTSCAGEESAMLRDVVHSCSQSLIAHGPSNLPANNALWGLALARAWSVTDDEGCSRAARDLFDKVLGTYDANVRGWREKSGPGSWLLEKARTADIGLCAMLANEVLPCDAAREVMELALGSMESMEELLDCDALANGNASTILLFAHAARLAQPLDARTYIERAGRILRGMMQRCDTVGSFVCSPPDVRNFFDVSLCRGTLGVGYATVGYLCALEEGSIC